MDFQLGSARIPVTVSKKNQTRQSRVPNVVASNITKQTMKILLLDEEMSVIELLTTLIDS